MPSARSSSPYVSAGGFTFLEVTLFCALHYIPGFSEHEFLTASGPGVCGLAWRDRRVAACGRDPVLCGRACQPVHRAGALRRGPCPQTGRSAGPEAMGRPPHRHAARLGQAHLRPVPRHPLQPGQVVLEGRAAPVLLRPVPLRLPVHRARRRLRRREWRDGAHQLQPGPVHFRAAGAPDGRQDGPALFRPAPALSHQHPGLQRRVRGVPGCLLFPRRRQGHDLRSVGARPCHRHRPAQWRGVPDVPGLLDQEARSGGHHGGGRGAARQPVRHRRLQVLDQAG